MLSRKPLSQIDDLAARARNFRVKNSDVRNVALLFWEGLDTPVSLGCALRMKYSEEAQLANMSVSPRDYPWDDWWANNSLSFRDDYQAVSLLKKWPGLTHPDLDPVEACAHSTAISHEECVATNRRLRRLHSSPKGDLETRYLHFILQMQLDIREVLGAFCPREWLSSCRFGPGSVLGQKGASPYDKLTSMPSVTEDFLPMGISLLSESDAWLNAVSQGPVDPFEDQHDEDYCYRFSTKVETGDIDQMVPKSAKTHRNIRPQPGLNAFAQLGIGEMMRKQLASKGLDLSDQSLNGMLAKHGSIKGQYVTIDLSRASDCISTYLVRWLFCDAPNWLHAMELTRTSCHSRDGGTTYIRNANYSAMGNGYTFELETLIFWTAVRAVRRFVGCTSQYRTYGDDIIVTKEVADVLVPFLSMLGFTTNEDKTFLEGPFRESCGEDWWRGTNVRPFFIKEHFDEALPDAIYGHEQLPAWLTICNGIRRLASSRNHGISCDRRLLASWRSAVLCIPRHLRDSLKGPDDALRDDCLITHLEDMMVNPLIKRCASWQTLIRPVLRLATVEGEPGGGLGAIASMLYTQNPSSRNYVKWDRSRSFLQRYVRSQQCNQVNRLYRGVEEGRLIASNLFRHHGLTPRKFEDIMDGSAKPVRASRILSIPRRFKSTLGLGWDHFQPSCCSPAWEMQGT